MYRNTGTHLLDEDSMAMMMDIFSVAFLVLALSTRGRSEVVEHFFARISDAHKSFLDGEVMTMDKVTDSLECARKCVDKSDVCKSYNVRTESDGTFTCAFFSSIPLSPRADLKSSQDTEYYEKSCQIPAGITASTKYENNNVPQPGKVFITMENGLKIYAVQFSPTFDITSVIYTNTVEGMTGGKTTRVGGMTQLDFDGNQHFNIFLTDSGVKCMNETNGQTDVPCLDPNPKPLVQAFGTHDVNALLTVPGQNQIMAFSYSKITFVEIGAQEWSVTEVIDISPESTTEGYSNMPLGVVGAAWIVEESEPGSFLYNKMFLITRYYYVVYDVTVDAILKRGHICKDMFGFVMPD